jgi:hypothetical protein
MREIGLVLALLSLASLTSAAQPQFWKLEGARDFLDGRLDGLSVDSEGEVRLAPVTRSLSNLDAAYVWCLTTDGKGTLYAGTGNEGRVFRVRDGAASVLWDAAELEVHALAWGPDGKLYAATSPDGKVYAVDPEGKAETFYDPIEKYIWAMLFDKQGNLLIATGAEGKVYQVDRKGKARALLSSPDMHVTSLALGDDGLLYAGSSPGGVVYRLDPAGKPFVIHDSPFREIKALAFRGGSLYVAAIDGKDKEEPRAPMPALAPVIPMAAADVTVTDTITVLPPTPAPAATTSPPLKPLETRPGVIKGAVIRISASGEVETIWSSADEMPFVLMAQPEAVLMGTGGKGHLYRLRDDRTWTMVSTLPAEQATALCRNGSDLAVGTSNPGTIHSMGEKMGREGTFVSKVKDTDTQSLWGRVRWEAVAPAGSAVQVESRSGNTGAPDTTWSDWSAPYTRANGEPVRSERARFVQVRVTLRGQETGSPTLDSVQVAYLQRNLRPQIESVTVHPPGEFFQKPLSLTGEVEILGFDGSNPSDRAQTPARTSPLPVTSYSRRLFQRGIQTLSWKADDPNGDTLTYEVHYRSVGDTRFRLLRKGLTDAVLAWETSTLPNGRYVVKVVASDAPSNPDSLALTGDKESAPFDVDTTPPTVTASLVKGTPPRITAQARDDMSMIRRAEYSVNGGRWQEVHPEDGINDATEESYSLTLGNLPTGGPHAVVIRVIDLLGNGATARVEVP